MNIKTYFINFIISFILVFVLISVITYLWNLVFHENGSVNWETSFAMAIILGIVLAWVEKKKH